MGKLACERCDARNGMERTAACARGGFVIDMEWKNREVVSLIVSSLKGGQTEICFNGVSKKVVFKAGEEKRLL